ncbi:MAG: sigma-70 family RNA polymerase sigma factor [Deltaproteobacteria bacterium]|nr:sigma-70 family RNA polymerase sigma factor [Deltaproteobacteria bacterium]
MFDTEFLNEGEGEFTSTAESPATGGVLSEADESEQDESHLGAMDAETLFSADLATTSLLTRSEEEVLARRIVRARNRIRRTLRGARRLCQAALVDRGRGVISPDEDFREREALAILNFARMAMRNQRAGQASGLARPRLKQFVKQLTQELTEYREVRDEMLRANLRLVNVFARRYHHPSLSMLDLFQEGSIGLMRAIEKYDPERNIKFSTYATWWIWQQLSRAADTQGSLIRMPVHWNQFRRRVNRDATERAAEKEGPVSRHELATAQGMERERFEEMAQAFQFVSSDAPLGEDDERTVESTLAAEGGEPDEQAEQSSLRNQLELALQQLPQRERIIVRQRFGLDDDDTETLEELGTQFGVSRERIRQLENRGLKRLREICARRGLEDFLH